jgi:hypothetical protein
LITENSVSDELEAKKADIDLNDEECAEVSE